MKFSLMWQQELQERQNEQPELQMIIFLFVSHKASTIFVFPFPTEALEL